MVTIWKYPLEVADRQEVEMPRGGRVLTVQTQRGQACLWVMVDTAMAVVTRTFHIYGTGHPISPDLRLDYIGTFWTFQPSNSLVFHVFEERS